MTISILPDDVLLEIFVFCRSILRVWHPYPYYAEWKWLLLAHVCRSWRQIIFASPQRLDLQIYCTPRTLVRKNLDIWPSFPIAMDYPYIISSSYEDNVIAALEHPDRVRHLRFQITALQLGKMAMVMRDPFPLLTHLDISVWDNAQVLPPEFLGGSAPRLQEICLDCTPFPSLPMLLLSASDLVTLELHDIPPAGYISPEAMVACLTALPRLDHIVIRFQSATSCPDRIGPSPITRVVLPALTSFKFTGASEYLEDLVARIDIPQLTWLRIDYLDRSVDLQVPQLSKFFNRSSVGADTEIASRSARVTFAIDGVTVNVPGHHRHLPCAGTYISYNFFARRLEVFHMTQVFNQFSAIFSTVVHLKLDVGLKVEDTGDVEWLHFLSQFSTVKTLQVSWKFAGDVAVALENITGEMVTKVLPSLDLICLDNQPSSSIEKFIAARRLSGRPVTVRETRTEF